jgi:hypothetical protein
MNDMTRDPLGFAEWQMDVVNAAVPRFSERLVREHESYQQLLVGFRMALSRYQQSASIASRFIGGLYVDRAMVNQPGATAPLTPVAVDDQRRAMVLLRERVFAPDAFVTLTSAGERLLAQRRGFDHFQRTEDPKLHDAVLGAQKSVLDHLLHPAVLKRLTDTRAYGNEYSASEMFEALTAGVFTADLASSVNTFRQNLQLEYVSRLVNIVQTNRNQYDHVAQTAALDRLRWIERELARARRSDAETAAHREHILYRIERGLDAPRE